MKILIAEDTPDSRLVLKKMLESSGHEVIEAINGQDALEKARLTSPELIVSDVLMPVMDGFKLCYEVKHDDALRNIPFVFYTATYIDLEDERLAISLGASRFIIKPMEPERFVEIMAEIIREVERKEIVIPEEPIAEPVDIFRKYDSRLAQKLVDKVLELELYNRVFDNSLDAIVVVNNYRHIVRQNNAHRQMLGYKDADLWGKSPFEYLNKDTVKVINESLESSGAAHGQCEVKTKTGLFRPVDYSIFPIKNEKSEIREYVWMLRDISSRLAAEKQLKAEKHKLERITQSIGVGIVEISREYKTIWANEVIQNIFGDVVGKQCHSKYNQRDAVCPDCGVKEVFEKGLSESTHEQVGKNADGKTIWSRIIATPLYDDQGKINSALEVVVDITEMKETEEKLRKAYNEWDRTFDAITDVVTIQDTELRIVRANNAACTMFNLPMEDMSASAVTNFSVDHQCPVKDALCHLQ
ncbi:MAG: PAS domain S-box protein [Desulfobulbaceae bacterium]|uniref:PAS domain S-box protein n=1 Tax=Candidatus Desulfobia pelagia TaxID=2841692 RepID=A0A8J6NBN2_9BACT|nr:PAS domain S-box protein [Candidatus Desulfobia pelagia]